MFQSDNFKVAVTNGLGGGSGVSPPSGLTGFGAVTPHPLLPGGGGVRTK